MLDSLKLHEFSSKLRFKLHGSLTALLGTVNVIVIGATCRMFGKSSG